MGFSGFSGRRTFGGHVVDDVGAACGLNALGERMVVNSPTRESGVESNLALARCAVSIRGRLRRRLHGRRMSPADRLSALSDKPKRDCGKQNIQSRSSRNLMRIKKC